MTRITVRVQWLFDWLANWLAPVENRWLIFVMFCGIMIFLRAGGMHGLAEMIGMMYVMYCVTLR